VARTITRSPPRCHRRERVSTGVVPHAAQRRGAARGNDFGAEKSEDAEICQVSWINRYRWSSPAPQGPSLHLCQGRQVLGPGSRPGHLRRSQSSPLYQDLCRPPGKEHGQVARRNIASTSCAHRQLGPIPVQRRARRRSHRLRLAHEAPEYRACEIVKIALFEWYLWGTGRGFERKSCV